MATGGRSVAAINRLERELRLAMDSLFLLLGATGAIFAAIFLLGLQPPVPLYRVPYLATDVLPRLGQSIVAGGTAFILMRAGQIPAILRRSLSIRHEIAVDEARRKTLENAGKVPEPDALFGRDPAFGRTVTLEEARRP